MSRATVTWLGDMWAMAQSRVTASPVAPTRTALRVAAIPNDAESGLLIVRILKEGEPLPAGSHEALLVAWEPGTDLLKPKA